MRTHLRCSVLLCTSLCVARSSFQICYLVSQTHFFSAHQPQCPLYLCHPIVSLHPQLNSFCSASRSTSVSRHAASSSNFSPLTSDQSYSNICIAHSRTFTSSAVEQTPLPELLKPQNTIILRDDDRYLAIL